jgi:DNA polymerase-3 subunit delta'
MIGHEWARNLLTRAAGRHRLSHSYLVVGPDSVGKTSLALYLAGLLICSADDGRPCGNCRACRSLARGSHPDVAVVERAADRRDITIDQIRQLEEAISLAPFEASHKLFCIAEADKMNDAAASALLKTLEEPPPHSTLVLAVVDPSGLPSTIRSRCQMITLQPVPAHTVAGALVADLGVPPHTAADLATLALGRPGWAVRALAESSLVEQERRSLATIYALSTDGPYSRMRAVEAWLGKGSFLETRERGLDFVAKLEAWWRDLLLIEVSNEAPDLRRYLVAGGPAIGVGIPDIVTFLFKIQETASRIEANVTPRLALEYLMSTMPNVKAA